MSTNCAEFKTKNAKPLLTTRISPIALGINFVRLIGLPPKAQAAHIRAAARNLAAIANELDGGVA